MNMFRFVSFACLLLTFYAPFAYAEEEVSFRIVSYNIENLFDWKDDPKTDDDAFTEQGDYQWTEKKFRRKLSHIAKALVAAGGWQTPVVIGLCEVENAFVLKELVSNTELKYAGYQFVHRDSPDLRGVDVALLYDPKRVRVVEKRFLPVPLEERPTRDILYAQGVLKETGDTLHLFVNHWPSRYGGELESEPKRIKAAQVLRSAVDSLFLRNDKANIIIMGDFNEYTSNESITRVLGAKNQWETAEPGILYNACFQYDGNESIGSHKFEGRWGMLDQFILSGHLLSDKEGLHTELSKVSICQEPFLLKPDRTGYAPKRAFLGCLFAYGFSDHLPICIDLVKKKK